MKKSLMFTTPLLALALSVFAHPTPANAVGATTITQADVAAALADLSGSTTVSGLTCHGGAPNYCNLAAGEYTLANDLNFSPAGQNAILRISENVTVDLNTHAITTTLGFSGNGSTVDIISGNVTLKNGTIANSTAGKSALSTENAAATTNLTLSGVTFNTDTTVELGASTTTLVNVTSSASQITVKGANLTVNGGTFNGVFNVEGDANVTVNSGSLNNGAASAMELTTDASNKAPKLTVNGGSFTSGFDAGLMANGYNSITINGGTFTGGLFGFTTSVYHGDIAISGGTFKATGAPGLGGDPVGAIVIKGEDETIADRILAANHSYTNPSTRVIDFPGMGGNVVVIGNNETSVVTAATPADNTPASTATNTSINAPKSGGDPAKETNATISLLPAAFIATLAVLVLAKFVEAKNEA